MRPAISLTLAIATGLSAVLLVAADVSWGVHVRLEGEFDGEWATLAESPPTDERWRPFETQECPLQDARVTLVNSAPYPVSKFMTVWYHGQQTQKLLFEDTVRLGARETKVIELELPPQPEVADEWPGNINLEIRSMNLYLYSNSCYQPPAKTNATMEVHA